jgi:hypothetical protein
MANTTQGRTIPTASVSARLDGLLNTVIIDIIGYL